MGDGITLVQVNKGDEAGDKDEGKQEYQHHHDLHGAPLHPLGGIQLLHDLLLELLGIADLVFVSSGVLILHSCPNQEGIIKDYAGGVYARGYIGMRKGEGKRRGKQGGGKKILI